MNTINFTHSDLVLFIIISSGILAGVLSYLMVPAQKRERQHCLKSALFGIAFAFLSSIGIEFAFGDRINGIPAELRTLFLWCASFLPAFVLALCYGVLARRQGTLEF